MAQNSIQKPFFFVQKNISEYTISISLHKYFLGFGLQASSIKLNRIWNYDYVNNLSKTNTPKIQHDWKIFLN